MTFDGEDPLELVPGDVLLVKGPDHYTVSDSPGRDPVVFVDTDEVCRDAAGASLAEEMLLGARTWGNSVTGRQPS
nr:cupin domain-containing protein [Ruania alba]